MPFYQFILRNENVPVSSKLEDDAKDAAELGERIQTALTEGKRLVTFSVVTEADLAAARRDGELEDDLPKVGEKIVNGSWDPNDILHVVAFDEILEAELEAEEAEEQEERVDPKLLTGGGKNNSRKK